MSQYTDRSLEAKRHMAQMMMKQGLAETPISSHWQGLARVLQAGAGGYFLNKFDEEEKQQQEQANQALMGLIGAPATTTPAPATAAPGGDMTTPAPSTTVPATTATTTPAPQPGGDMDQYAAAIAKKESGGNYQLIGPPVKRKNGEVDRAFGKYQVMGENVGPWTQEVLGKPMTPKEFLANPDAQEMVFRAKFGQSVAKYGNPEDAASVWFTGRPAAEGANSRDMLGTTGAGYVADFRRNVAAAGGGAPGMAAAGGGAPGKVLAIPDDLRSKIGALLSNPRTRPFGEALIQKFITAQGAQQPSELERRAAAGGLQPGTPEYQAFMLRGGVRDPMEIERRAEAGGLKPGTPEYQAFVLYNGKGAPESEIKNSDLGARASAAGLKPGTPEYQAFMLQGAPEMSPAARQARDAGLTPGSDEYKQFVMQGGQKPLTSQEMKDIKEAEDKFATNKEVIGTLNEAMSLNDKAYFGPMASTRAYITSLAGNEEGIITRDVENMVQTQAIQQLKAIFGGMPTEGERKILLELQGSMSENPKTRGKIWERARDMAIRRLEMNERELNQMRGRTYYKPGGGESGSTSNLTEIPKQRPTAGHVEGGYRFKGGDPSKAENWERVQ